MQNKFGSLAICCVVLLVVCSSISVSTDNLSKTLTHANSSADLSKNTVSSSQYLTGHFEYENKRLSQVLPLAFASVEICTATAPYQCLGVGSTDKYGNYTFGPVDVPPDGIYITCEVNTTTCTIDPRVTVLYYNCEYEWSFESPAIRISPGQEGFLCYVPDPDKAFTVFSVDTGLNKGWNYTYYSTGTDIVGAKANYPSAGPAYDNNTRRIHLCGSTYQYTDTILHEYSHYVMHCLYDHWYWPQDYDIFHERNESSNNSTAWIEGWAWYFPLAVKNNGTYIAQDFQCDFENRTWATPNWDDGDIVEGRIAGAFLDIYDPLNDTGPWSYENMTDGFGRIWNTTSLACSVNNSAYRMFWVIWNGTYYHHPKDPTSPYGLQDWTNTLMSIFQNSIDYRGPGDVNADGKVNIKDLTYVLLHNGEEEGISPNWNYLADLVHDGKINVKDVALVAGNVGKTYDC
jgi:hypothetical protein